MTWLEVEEAVHRNLTLRLDARSDRPIAVAFSGGGDSLALLIAARSWARRIGRPLISLTVDHGLSSESGAWTSWCARRVRDLEVEHRRLIWSGSKPATGIPAAARTARHRLLADAAREAGASVILMGHTADDRLEARLMRAEGSSVSEPRAWSPSPAWPHGRDIFLIRPLIGVRRETIRRGLRERGETWLEDPSNTSEASLRALVRMRIAGTGDPGPPDEPCCSQSLHRAATVGWAGDIALPLQALRSAPDAARTRFLRAALSCAAGGAASPRGAQIDRLWDRVSETRPTTATLAGARIERNGDTVRMMRDDGSIREVAPASGKSPVIFDGRFEIAGIPDGHVLTAMRGYMSRLDSAEHARVRTAPPAARRSLPVWVDPRGASRCPLIEKPGQGRVRNLVAARLAAALGAVAVEAAIGRVGETALGVLDMAASTERSVHEPA